MVSRSSSGETLAPDFSRVFFRSALGFSQGQRWDPCFWTEHPETRCSDDISVWWSHCVPLAEAAGPHCVHVQGEWCWFPPVSLCSFLCIWKCCWEVSREKLGPCFQHNVELYRLTGTSRKRWQDSRHPQEANPIRKHWCHWQTKQMSAGKTNCFPVLLIFPRIRSSLPLLFGPVWQIIYKTVLQQCFFLTPANLISLIFFLFLV